MYAWHTLVSFSVVGALADQAELPATRSSYTLLDFSVFLGYFLVVVVIGFLAGRGQQTSVGGYFRGGNRLPWFVIGSSIIAAGISSEQFVSEMGYAYQVGMPVVNWEWLVFPALSILLWIFVPLYVRNRITTMPEYLERRFGPAVRKIYAYLTVASYVLVNFALVFYTGGVALEAMTEGFIHRLVAVWILALVTGLYTVYGGLRAVAWTSSFQCFLLLGGGLYVFFAGMAAIGWDFEAMFGSGQRAHLFTPAHDAEVPWMALLFLALSTNVWYYATNQYINQRCLAARNEWHAKMGVLFAGGLQVLIPLATCFPGMIYRVLNPHLEDFNTAYPMVVAAVVPVGLRGLVSAAIVGAIMSTISGLVNSTSTIVTLDIVRHSVGVNWSEQRLVRVGRWSGAMALLIGALLAPLVMRWESIFRYAQDIWAPMAAPIVVVFFCGALWSSATERGACACMWLAMLTVPLTLVRKILAENGISILPANLENPMVLSGTIYLISWAIMATLRNRRRPAAGWFMALAASALLVLVGTWSSVVTAALVAAAMGVFVGCPLVRRSLPSAGLWDQSMLVSGVKVRWFSRVGIWWFLLAVLFGGLYVYFW
ncbi:MAG: sodium/solute symporter [Pirellulales bacterium]|nr:sodium/solute symporter [Pirellulales bacterium]